LTFVINSSSLIRRVAKARCTKVVELLKINRRIARSSPKRTKMMMGPNLRIMALRMRKLKTIATMRAAMSQSSQSVAKT